MIHFQTEHAGVSHVLAKIRERFWIVKARSLVKSVIHRCVICRRYEGGNYKLPPMPFLPEIRLAEAAPFLHVGIDYFGPIFIKSHLGSPTEAQALIFTCLVTRAVHLELVPDLTGNNCFLALLRFSSIRRLPKLIISDNATTFTFLQPLIGIKVQINDYKINEFVTTNRVAWYFIPQYMLPSSGEHMKD